MSFYSRESALELADRMVAAREGVPEFELGIVLIEPGQGEKIVGTYLVREVREAQRMASGHEVAHCATVAKGRLIDIYFPPTTSRAIEIAEILIED